MISFILASGTNQPGTVGVKASLAGILVTSLSAGITTTLAVLQLVKQTIKGRIKKLTVAFANGQINIL